MYSIYHTRYWREIHPQSVFFCNSLQTQTRPRVQLESAGLEAEHVEVRIDAANFILSLTNPFLGGGFNPILVKLDHFPK